MGDIIETTVAAFQPFFYYKVSGNGLQFEIKAQNSGLIGLVETCGRTQYWFEISNDDGSGVIKIIENNQAIVTKSGLPFTLTADNYTRFWIAWNSRLVWAGIGKQSDVAISYRTSLRLKYITFATTDSPYQSHFRFEVPPLCLRVPKVLNEPELIRGKLVWKRCHDQLPDEAVIGGHINGEIVYIVRAHHRLSLTPGVFIPSKGLAYIPWGESDNPTGNFEALCGVDLKWKAATAHTMPVDAFVAGYSEDHHEPLYIGRASIEGNKIPGKIQLSHYTCYIAHKGKEIALKNFDVLVVPGLNAHCTNKYLKFVRRVGIVFYNHHVPEEDSEVED